MITRTHRLELVHLIDLNHLAPFLIYKEVLPSDVLEDIYKYETETERKHQLLKQLSSRGPDVLAKFLEALETSGHSHATDSLKRQCIQSSSNQDENRPNVLSSGHQRSVGKTRSHVPSQNKLFQLTVKPAKELRTGPNIYKMTSEIKGMCLIINNVNFDSEKDIRLGSDRDAERLGMVFDDLGYLVLEPLRDLTADDMKDELQNFAKRSEHRLFDSCVVIILSHGKENIVYGRDKKPVYMHEIQNFFNNRNCVALQDKPKLFFIQACRGRNYNIGVPRIVNDEIEHDATLWDASRIDAVVKNEDSEERMPLLTDMLISYSTVEGNISIRHEILGAWYCQQLVCVLMEKAHDCELRDILDEVNRRVQRYTSSDGELQATSYEAIGWNNKLYFNPKICEPPFYLLPCRYMVKLLSCAWPYLLVAFVVTMTVLILLLWYTEPISGMLSHILL